MNALNKIAKVGSKCIEILHWVGAGCGVVALIITFIAPESINSFIAANINEIQVYSYNSKVLLDNAAINWTAVRVFAIAVIISCTLMAMVGRNLFLIFTTMEGKNKHIEGSGPFQSDVVRLVREIGIFYLAIPVLSLLLSFVARLLVGSEIVDTSVDIGGIITGVVILCLSQVFAYGVELQQEVDGLL